jgi:uncharacterized protein
MGKFVILLASITLMAHACSGSTWQRSQELNNTRQYSDGTVVVKDQTINVDLARTSAERAVGLSGRAQIRDDQGMLFIFDSAGNYAFWMKGMQIAIDIIWINDNQIVDISRNVPIERQGTPEASYATYSPKAPVDKVLEVRAGWSDAYGIKEGDTVGIEIKGI